MRRLVAVASSGGRDSTALLHCTVRAAAQLDIDVLAMHVHHGLQEQADAWLHHVRRQALRWGARFDSRRLSSQPAPGESIEAWARKARYQALGEMAQAAGCELVLLGHHRRDQAETWLLQALRGGSAAGLSAMPRSIKRMGVTWARPWLDEPREAVEAYVHRHRLSHIEDGSNDDPRYARNRLRLQVWPALSCAFADVETSLFAAARRAQEACALEREVLALDLPSVLAEKALDVGAWRLLPPARRRNALRGWLAQQLGREPPESLTKRLSVELPDANSARWQAPGCELRLHGGVLRLAESGQAAKGSGEPVVLDLSRPGAHRLPAWQGCFEVIEASDQGVPPDSLREVQARERSGGERFSLAPQGTPRSLKKQFQARGVAAWERGGPLLFGADGNLLFVPGLGLDARIWARVGEPQLRLRWVPDVT